MNEKDLFNPSNKFYCIIDHVSRSGLSRVERFYVIHDNRLVSITAKIAQILHMPIEKGGIRVEGCGLDAGEDLLRRAILAINPDMRLADLKFSLIYI